MAIPLIFAAIILFAAAYQNQIGYLASNLGSDFTGFFPWFLAILVIAAIGLIPRAKPVAYALLGLVFLVLFIVNKGVFANLQNLKPINPPAAPVAPGSVAKTPAAAPDVQKSGSNESVPTSTGGSVLSTLGNVFNPLSGGPIGFAIRGFQ